MKNQIKQRLYQVSIMTVKIVLGSMLALSTFVLFYFGLINRGYVRTYRYTSIGFIGFLVGGLTELLIIFLNIHVMKASVPIVVGLGFLLTFIVIQQVDDPAKAQCGKAAGNRRLRGEDAVPCEHVP